jgi:hypothetical protein
MWVHFLSSVGCKFNNQRPGLFLGGVRHQRTPPTPVDSLIAGPAPTRAAVTTAERDEPRSLLDAMGVPTDITSGLSVQG